MSTLTTREQARFDALAKKGGYAVSLKKSSPAKVTKGASTRETLSRKAWNKTASTKARLAGKRNGVTVYSAMIAEWGTKGTGADLARTQGFTPDEFVAAIIAGM